MTAIPEAFDSLGRLLKPKQKVIVTVDQQFSVGVIDEIYQRPSRYNNYQQTIVKLRRVSFTKNYQTNGVEMSKAAVGRIEDHYKLTIVDSFDFIPLTRKIEVEVALGC